MKCGCTTTCCPLLCPGTRKIRRGPTFIPTPRRSMRARPGTYLAFPTPYYHYDFSERAYLNQPALDNGGKSNDGIIETQLAVSRDGKNWKRYRAPYLPLTSADGLDLKIVMALCGLIYHKQTIDQYFAGYTFTHGDTQARRQKQGRELGGIWRAEQRRDGFTSLDFAYGAAKPSPSRSRSRATGCGSISIPRPRARRASPSLMRKAGNCRRSRWPTAESSMATTWIWLQVGMLPRTVSCKTSAYWRAPSPAQILDAWCETVRLSIYR